MQQTINNDISFIDKSSNEICFNFTSTINKDLFVTNVQMSVLQRIAIIDNIVIT